ncbi:MAG: VPLPA-CTERM sorting domain-containing protein [Thermodesulfobacteriota bacterium]|nr:VPLPA-CTERM sorting domain-containing protein [Thermodesulfobacteriota bacterium]
MVVAANNPYLGWKTSLDHVEDDVVYFHGLNGNELKDPVTAGSLDMAFVITGEPVPVPPAVWLLGSGLIGLVGIRRRYKP